VYLTNDSDSSLTGRNSMFVALPFSITAYLIFNMSSQKETGDPYGAIQFGEFRKYMQNKQSKLKKQQTEL
jgi:hypothetical protein